MKTSDELVYEEKSKYVTVLLLNPTSLAKTNAVQQLQCDLINNNVQVALVTETWFCNKHLDCMADIDGYTIYRCDRNGRKGGGVCAYVRNDITGQIACS